MHSPPSLRAAKVQQLLVPLGALLIALVVITSGCGGCSSEGSDRRRKSALILGGEGAPVHAGRVSNLRVAPGGAFVTFLMRTEGRKVDGRPSDVGELWALPLSGPVVARRLEEAVSGASGAYRFSLDGRWVLVLSGYDAVKKSGVLRVHDLRVPASSPVHLADEVTFVGSSPDGTMIALIERGALKVGTLPHGPLREIDRGIVSAEFSADGRKLYYVRRIGSASHLKVVEVKAPTDGDPITIAEHADSYDLSLDGRYLAFTRRDATRAGHNDFFLTPTAAFDPVKIGSGVGSFAFSPDSSAVASLHTSDSSAGAGPLSVTELALGTTRRLGTRVTSFAWSPDGKHIAFLSHSAGSSDLMVYSRAADRVTNASIAVLGYSFTYPGGPLLFRTNCLAATRACVLGAFDPSRPDTAPEGLLAEIEDFRVSEDGTRVLVTYGRPRTEIYDVALYDVKSRHRILLDQFVLRPALFADPRGESVVYVLEEGSRGAGVYVARPDMTPPPKAHCE